MFNKHYLFGPCLLTVLFACKQKAEPAPATDPAKEMEQLLGKVITDTATTNAVRDEILVSGKIVPDEDSQIRIYPMVSGIVRKVNVHSGWYVKSGQTLAELVSSEMAGFSNELAAAEASLANAKRDLSLKQDLLASGLASEKDVEEAKSEYKRASSEVHKAEQVLRINGGDRESGYRITTPINGFVIEKKVTEHSHLRPDNNDPVFVIADISNVWAMVNIYESDISYIHQGDSVHLTSLSYPGKVFKGVIEKIYQMLDPDTKTMRARINIHNPDLLLKPEMFVSAKVKVVQQHSRVSIPVRSLIFDNNRYYVVVREGNTARIQPVEVAEKMGGRAYISAGLDENEVVVSSRQLYFYEALKQ
ncbi:MAG: efflux RND transporter periplasmic adaptor subunit [Chitinophagaceae bacterium]|nr:efflux RND transporter periplasmic adaptor subunit [Chitinophagaceae bacterium]